MSANRHEIPRGPAQKPPRPLSPVVHAGPQDCDDLIEFLHEVRDELDRGHADEEMIVALARDLSHYRGGTALIVRGPARIEASMGLAAERPLLSRSHHLRAVWHVVLPEARLTGHAKSLFVAAKAFADSLGRPLLVTEFSPQPNAPKIRLASRHLPVAGALFLHEPA